jgi:4-hydroxy-tetrahydrodipicolinate synthase
MEIGVYPAAVTPFNERGAIDFPGVARLLARFADKGCKGVVVAGTNGEGPSLTTPEKSELIRFAVAHGGSLEAVLGIASNSVDEAAWLCRQAGDAGCRTVLLMPPSYFREATEEGLESWFRSVLDRSPVNVLIYNFPKRTGLALSPELVHRLGSHDRMVGLKDSSGSRENLAAYAQAVPGKLLYVGDETLLTEALTAGWSGTISGAANVLPEWLVQVVAEWHAQQESAEAKFGVILPHIEALRSLPQPAANKRALRELGIIDDDRLRPPLIGMADLPAALSECLRLGR